jgi:hypothetical protein
MDGLYAVANSIDEIWPLIEEPRGYKTAWLAEP